LVLAGGSLQITQTFNDLVINPLESMINKVKRIAEDPLKAAQLEENE